MFYAYPSRKKYKTLIITNDINRVRPKRCEAFEYFEDIPLQEYEDYILLGIENEILYEALNEKGLLRDFLTKRNTGEVFHRIYI